jgi:hypothetical protein
VEAGWNTPTVALRDVEGDEKGIRSRGGRGVITGAPCHKGTYIQRSGPPGWGLDARLTTLLCKKNIFPKSKEVKSGCSNLRQIWQNLLRKAVARKGAGLSVVMMMILNICNSLND